jgi:hypothetical protein
LIAVGVSACTADTKTSTLDAIAESYVQLVLAMGEHDPDYVDAYFGPAELAELAPERFPTLEAIRDEAGKLQQSLRALTTPAEDIVRRRIQGLDKRLIALQARIDMVSGETLPFDEESRLLFDAVAPDHDAEHFEGILEEIDALVPGDGDLNERAVAFRNQFVIPPDLLDAVFSAAINECRRRTAERIPLPAQENFTLEYVTDKPWSGYNWFKGDAYSLIQINTDLPRHIDRAIDLGCHEGYPGHHTYHTLQERNLYRDRAWIEFSVYPLFSPQSLLSEGSANYGIDLAFPGDERIAYEKSVLFPLAGLDTEQADVYYNFLELRRQLSYARNEAARDYLDGTISREDAVAWIRRYGLSSADEAREAGEDQARRWALFETLISEPASVADISEQ